MVPAQQEEVFRVLDLVGEEETDGLQRLLASIDVVALKTSFVEFKPIAFSQKTPTILQCLFPILLQETHGEP